MPYRIEIYIGSDNDSRRICKGYLKKVRHWADVIFPEGYTLIKGEGCYNGIHEDSLIINVLSNYDVSVNDRLKKLKHELMQDAILIIRSPVDFEII